MSEEIVTKPKRKTHTSTEVKRRYNDKTYSRVYADLPKELVGKFKAAAQEQGVSVASIFKKVMEEYIADFPPKEE